MHREAVYHRATDVVPFVDRRTVELVHQTKKTAGMRDVKEVISAMQNSPTAGYLQDLSLHERIMLAAVLKCVKREGVEEVKWGDVSRLFLVGCWGCTLILGWFFRSSINT